MCSYCVAGIELDKNVNSPFWMQTHLQNHFQNDKLVFNTILQRNKKILLLDSFS